MNKKIPNYLTMARIAMVVAIIVFASIVREHPGQFMDEVILEINRYQLVIFILFATASITDFLDGYLARKYDAISNFGKLMDPIADKLLVNTTLILFAVEGTIPFFVVALFIARDFFTDGLRMLALEKKVVIAASFLGKLKTVFQMIGLILVILNIGSKFHLPLIAIIIALAVSLLSAVEYYVKNFNKVFK